MVAVRTFNCGGGSVTVSVAVPDLPSTDAVIVMEPATNPGRSRSRTGRRTYRGNRGCTAGPGKGLAGITVLSDS